MPGGYYKKKKKGFKKRHVKDIIIFLTNKTKNINMPVNNLIFLTKRNTKCENMVHNNIKT